ncbi:MAG TPA: hypothetical protein VF902_01550, partial [Coriobacteriia bacterium]
MTWSDEGVEDLLSAPAQDAASEETPEAAVDDALEGAPDAAPDADAAPEEADAGSVAAARLDRSVTIALWVVGGALVALAAFFAYSVYVQRQAASLSSPAL